MKLSQLEQINVEDLEQTVQDLHARYEALFGTDALQENHVDWPQIILLLKERLNRSARKDHAAIDRIMRDLCDAQSCDVHELHDQFVSAERMTPDEWANSP